MNLYLRAWMIGVLLILIALRAGVYIGERSKVQVYRGSDKDWTTHGGTK